MNNMSGAWRSVSHVECVCWSRTQPVCAQDVNRQEQSHSMSREDVINYFRIWVTLPWQFWVTVVCRAQQSGSGAC